MNENIDLTKILKNCPKGWKFWSPIFGEVEFERNYENKGFFNVSLVEDGTEWSFVYDATIFLGNIKSREIMLYPSKEQRDWSKFTAPWYKEDRFDPKTLKPFQRVLVRDSNIDVWQCEMFSHFCSRETTYPFFCCGSPYYYCIPYNSETEHILGTTEEAPKYYRYWED